MSSNHDDSLNILSARVASVETDIRNIASSVDKLSTAVAALGDKVGSASRTDWSVLASWSAVIITVLGALGVMATNPIKEDLLEINKRIYRHHDLPGHDASVERIKALERAVFKEPRY